MTGLIELTERPASADDGAGGEVRTGDELHQFIDRCFRIVEQVNGCIDDFTEVVRRDIGCHTHTDTGGAVYEQLRELCGENGGFHIGFVKCGDHINGFFFDIGEHFFAETFHAALGVTAGGGGVAVDASEVALTFNEFAAH